jgi:hypothetical protein
MDSFCEMNYICKAKDVCVCYVRSEIIVYKLAVWLVLIVANKEVNLRTLCDIG